VSRCRLLGAHVCCKTGIDSISRMPSEKWHIPLPVRWISDESYAFITINYIFEVAQRTKYTARSTASCKLGMSGKEHRQRKKYRVNKILPRILKCVCSLRRLSVANISLCDVVISVRRSVTSAHPVTRPSAAAALWLRVQKTHVNQRWILSTAMSGLSCDVTVWL